MGFPVLVCSLKQRIKPKPWLPERALSDGWIDSNRVFRISWEVSIYEANLGSGTMFTSLSLSLEIKCLF